MIMFALVSALGLALLSGTTRPVIIMVGLDFFIASFAAGVGEAVDIPGRGVPHRGSRAGGGVLRWSTGWLTSL
jgi:hypothetical protein